MPNPESADDVIAIERRIDAPPEVVFSFLTDPIRFARWMGTSAELDARPGGLYRIQVRPGQVAAGRYEVVEAPNRLVFTWGWEGDSEVPPGSTRVEVVLRAHGAGTVVELRHSGFASETARKSHQEGWSLYVDQLVAVAVD